MNTFHPYKDEEESDDQNYYDNEDMLDGYGVEINNQLREQPIDTDMLPPDDESMHNMDLLINSKESVDYSNAQKNKARYYIQQETGNFQGKRKEWGQKSPQRKTETATGIQKDRQISREPKYADKYNSNITREENYSAVPDSQMVPDVSQLNEDDFLDDDYDDRDDSRDETNQSIQEKDLRDLLETHNEFFKNVAKMGFSNVHMKDIEKVEKDCRDLIINAIMSKNSKQYAHIKEYINSELKNLIEKLTVTTEPKVQSRPPPLKVEDLSQEGQNQNLHPNIKMKYQYDEQKLDQSALRHSEVEIPASVNNYQTPNKVVQATPYEGVQKRGVFHSNIKHSNDRDQKGENMNISPKPSPIHMKNEFPDEYEESEQFDEEEKCLTILQRLPHKRWQYRRNAYKEVAEQFIQSSQGKKFFLLGQDGTDFEYNPLEKFQEWLITMIRDSNLIAQYEGL